MPLNTIALALTAGFLWAIGLLLVILANLIWPGYGNAFLDVMDSIYPGYHRGTGIGLMVGPLYAFLDGFILGWIFAWLYNKLSGLNGSSK